METGMHFLAARHERRISMKCPVCKHHEHVDIELHSDGFTEGIMECPICGTMWSVNHGVTEIVRDPQEKSFLEAQSECVEGDDYNLDGA
jgi:uncharacterized Zn finger protein